VHINCTAFIKQAESILNCSNVRSERSITVLEFLRNCSLLIIHLLISSNIEVKQLILSMCSCFLIIVGKIPVFS